MSRTQTLENLEKTCTEMTEVFEHCVLCNHKFNAIKCLCDKMETGKTFNLLQGVYIIGIFNPENN